jgi:hypothetical protein
VTPFLFIFQQIILREVNSILLQHVPPFLVTPFFNSIPVILLRDVHIILLHHVPLLNDAIFFLFQQIILREVHSILLQHAVFFFVTPFFILFQQIIPERLTAFYPSISLEKYTTVHFISCSTSYLSFTGYFLFLFQLIIFREGTVLLSHVLPFFVAPRHLIPFFWMTTFCIAFYESYHSMV